MKRRDISRDMSLFSLFALTIADRPFIPPTLLDATTYSEPSPVYPICLLFLTSYFLYQGQTQGGTPLLRALPSHRHRFTVD